MKKDHYYACWLKIAGISSNKLPDDKEGHTGKFNLYNDKALDTEGDKDWMECGYRSCDAQVGHFPQLHPLTDDYPFYMPYQYAGKEPIANVNGYKLKPDRAVGISFACVHKLGNVVVKPAL